MGNQLILGKHSFSSRLLVGTGKFASHEIMLHAIKASGAQLVTVSIRHFNPGNPSDDVAGPLTRLPDVTLVPNTSGARTAEEAVAAAEVARELSGSSFLKLEIHPNPNHLLPDPIETFLAAQQLVKRGFIVLPYMPADPVLAKRLEDTGCAAVMPLGSPIGSGQGLRTTDMLRIIIENSRIPVIVDAGIRSPSEAMAVMEMGGDAVLINSAIACAHDPESMAAAFATAVATGLQTREAGLMSRGTSASASSPLTSFLQ